MNAFASPSNTAGILYLHGFRSSPQSTKARLMAQAMTERGRAAQWVCPQLPASPAAAGQLAASMADRLLQNLPAPRALTIIGSSLGGFYATYLAERLDCQAVLLNPAVHAARDLATQIGEHRSYHDDQPYRFLPEYVDELKAMHTAAITHPERYFLIAATGDEVLDWREMCARYVGCRQRIVPGSDHGLSDFPRWMPEVLAFALGEETS